MEYNIGDMVVRHVFMEYQWDMVGVITAKRPHDTKEGESYYTIHWFAQEKNLGADTWQVHEFDLIEIAKKLEEKT